MAKLMPKYANVQTGGLKVDSRIERKVLALRKKGLTYRAIAADTSIGLGTAFRIVRDQDKRAPPSKVKRNGQGKTHAHATKGRQRKAHTAKRGQRKVVCKSI
jgi:hypothetical protein